MSAELEQEGNKSVNYVANVFCALDIGAAISKNVQN